jgi:tRNA pseudouridine32 synthase/23S rRNA pseudouridine746 synthase
MTSPRLPLPPILASGKTWLVIDKPAGMAVHPGPLTLESLEDLLPAFAQHGVLPQPVHRLDRDTSGCLLLGRRASAIRSLSRAFAEGQVEKRYLAILCGTLPGDQGRLSRPLAKRSTRAAGWRMVPDDAGQQAITDWRRIGSRDGLSLVEFRPLTGRTHQIRVHATLLGEGTAIVGDPIYGAASADGLMLHASSLMFPDLLGSERIGVESPLPVRFARRGLA